MKIFTLFVCFVLAFCRVFASTDHAENSVYPSAFPVGSQIPSLVFNGSKPINVTEASMSGPIILIRYLGYTCSHCVEQLTYVNRNASSLKRLGIRVIAFSPDDEETIKQMMQTMKYDSTVLTVLSDTDEEQARTLGAVREANGVDVELHAAMVLYQGTIGFSFFSLNPYMDLEHIASVAQSMKNNINGNRVQSTETHPSDRYLNGPVYAVTVARPSEGINEPMDLDFNHSPLHPNDLWVVNTGKSGNAIAILHNATDSAQRFIRIKKDSRASHFMWRTHAIAMGSNGTFATAQNGAPGNFNPFYQFMGPTLWSADTAVFASRYQGDNNILASHLDMLHQSPMNLGIAHDHGNAFWVSDAYYKDITFYDFKDPHEVGGTDHRDGIIRRYTDATVSGGTLGEPGHIALDKTSGFLYIVDAGANIVSRLDTKTGSFSRNLVAPPESAENLAEYSEWKGALVDTVLSSDLGEPVGIEVNGSRLFVGDRASGAIRIYQIKDTTLEFLGAVQTGAKELLGICYGPDDCLWFTDRASSTVGKLTTASEASIVAARDVMVADKQTTVAFTYHNAGQSTAISTLAYIRTSGADGTGEWERLPYSDQAAVPSNSMHLFEVALALPDTLHAFEVELREDLGSGNEGRRAHTVIVPKSVTRAIVDDAVLEDFRITQSVEQTNRVGYVSLRSDVFVRVADQLPELRTILWNGGSFGEISTVDDAVLQHLLDRGIEIMLIADDPLLLRTDLPSPSAFFNRFGVRLKGVDQVSPDNGQRVFNGVKTDTISFDMKNVVFQLPRLDHHRGIYYIPNVLFTKSSDSTRYVLQANDSSRVLAVRYTSPEYRSVLLGVNAARFLDGIIRTAFLDRSLEWLESATITDTTSTTDVQEREQLRQPSIAIRNNITSTFATAVIDGTDTRLQAELYSIGGQLVSSLYEGRLQEHLELPIDLSSLANGTYFVIVRTADRVMYKTVIKQ